MLPSADLYHQVQRFQGCADAGGIRPDPAIHNTWPRIVAAEQQAWLAAAAAADCALPGLQARPQRLTRCTAPSATCQTEWVPGAKCSGLCSAADRQHMLLLCRSRAIAG